MVQLSVIIACLDGEATLSETLDGLSAQRWDRSWEIILADNGSTDGSVELFQAHARAHPELAMRVLDASAVRGKSHALNAAIAAAQGRAIAICDADDVPGTGWLAAMGQALARHPFVAARMDYDRLNHGWVRRYRGHAQERGLEPLPFLPGFVHTGGGLMGFRKSLFEKIGPFDPAFPCCEDTDFCIRAQLAGYRIRFVPQAVMHIRSRDVIAHIYRQNFNWAKYTVKLAKRYRARGVATDGSWRRFWRQGKSFLRQRLHSPKRDMKERAVLSAGLGDLTGKLAGSIVYRTTPH